jgi:hypothetical protein
MSAQILLYTLDVQRRGDATGSRFDVGHESMLRGDVTATLKTLDKPGEVSLLRENMITHDGELRGRRASYTRVGLAIVRALCSHPATVERGRVSVVSETLNAADMISGKRTSAPSERP